MNIKTFIELHRIPNTSRVIAMQHVMDHHGDLEPSEYRVRIIEFSGRGDELPDREARYVYLYLAQELITMHFHGQDDQINRAVVYNIAEKKAIDYIAKNQHLFVEHEEVVKVDATTGKVKQKRGVKKDKVCALWAELKDTNMSRKEWIALLVKEVDMTKAGASTYFASLRNGTFGC